MIDKDVYCSIIHGGLNLNFKSDLLQAQSCCLRGKDSPVDKTINLWNQQVLLDLRQLNKQNIWDETCSKLCHQVEKSNLTSMRLGMNQGLTPYDQPNDLTGPIRIDLMFDLSCNLACRICGPDNSTFWQKHLKAHGHWNKPISTQIGKEEVIGQLKTLDLSNLRMLVFAGGETLLGQAYWDIAAWLADNVPNAKQNLVLCFQTNGTQSISKRNFDIIEKFHLVKIQISLDGTKEKFEYLRWPASWNQTTDNILTMRDTLPSNVMFLVEETVSTFNLAYIDELQQWTSEYFSTNREGDITVHSRHMAIGKYSIDFLSQEYVDNTTKYRQLIPATWKEQPVGITAMIDQIKKFDQYRNQSFSKTFPEVAEYYKRYLT
jgi:sulfatase maturation enzyme AslB (radical SAM superfamily)